MKRKNVVKFMQLFTIKSSIDFIYFDRKFAFILIYEFLINEISFCSHKKRITLAKEP